MIRHASKALDEWMGRKVRQPLVIRGARQVGKTWLVRDFARRAQKELIEINFERDPHLAGYFKPGDPQKILDELSLHLGREILPEASLLFLDEIQAADNVLPSLRWFFEELPQLPVVAAGSLLDFMLADHKMSVPVGRISYLYLEPMSFSEYLMAHGESRLLESIESWRVGTELSPAAHMRASQLYERYIMVGGMPGIVEADASGAGPSSCRRLQRDLMRTYRDDFAKYTGRMDWRVLDAVLLAVAGQLGRKFVYSKAGPGVKQHQVKHALELMDKARLCHIIRYSASGRVPLGGEVKDTFRKVVLLDVGIWHALVGSPASTVFPSCQSLSPQLRGQLHEQMTGQQLRAVAGPLQEPNLYYWQREGGRPGEIDFLLQAHGQVIPVELKAGAAGSMKSLHQYMKDKGLDQALRLDTNPPTMQALDLKTTKGGSVRYRLLSLPHYLTWNVVNILG